MEHIIDPGTLGWVLGWFVAVGLLFALALALPLQIRGGRSRSFLYSAGVVLAAFAVTALAASALVLHDIHVDLTREKVFTPAQQALAVVDALEQPVKLAYFYRAQDQNGRRMKEIVEVMARRNPLLDARAVDPDREPSLAQTSGVKIYNAAVIEADRRRLVVNTTDENDVAIGIQRVLRERVVTVCFVEGHGELPMDNFEFHTHLEGLADHSHGDAASKVVEMAGHGVGRLRRALEAQGFETRKVVLAIVPDVPKDCAVLVSASPRKTFLPGESEALRRYLQAGGSLLAAYDLGFGFEPGLAGLVRDLGADPAREVVVDPLSHYGTDAEMVAIAGYDPHPVTKPLSMTFFPGVRPLGKVAPAAGLTATPLLVSSRDSFTREVPDAGALTPPVPRQAAPTAQGSRVIGLATEGRLPGALPGAPPLRAIVIGDGDFLSNSFLPYMANADLAVSAIRWLVREDQVATISSRIPVPALVLLTPSQMKGIFLVVEVLLPLAVILTGAVVWWRRR